MPSVSQKSTAGRRSQAATKVSDISLQVMVPAHIKREVSVRAAKEGTTQRTIILTALRAIGFAVDEEDRCDKRKAR